MRDLSGPSFKDEYEPASFALSLARKDIGLATELAK